MNEVSQAVFAANVRHVAMLDEVYGMDVEGTEDTGFTCLQISKDVDLSLIHISEPTRRYAISYAVFC